VEAEAGSGKHMAANAEDTTTAAAAGSLLAPPAACDVMEGMFGFHNLCSICAVENTEREGPSGAVGVP